MKKIYLLCMLALFLCCKPQKENVKVCKAEKVKIPVLNLEQANKLSKLPLLCINTEYPNKLGQTLKSAVDLKTPQNLHPAFYGCFDWHSSVHGHWSLVALLRQFPNLENAEQIKKRLLSDISKEHILKELDYFNSDKHFERTYGWAWLLKLAEELHRWESPEARALEQNLQPLTDKIVQSYLEYLPKLHYPNRVGTHANTAFGLCFAWDYALALQNKELQEVIQKRAMDFYFSDTACPLSYEPSGHDFLSPCLMEANVMSRILPKKKFQAWFSKFLPQLKDKNFLLEVGRVADREDGHLVHLDGLNFSRAWALLEITKDLEGYEHLCPIIGVHIQHSLPHIFNDSYEGGHWLGTFAIYALGAAR